MKKKQVWRYYCEYCKKANCSGSAIAKHEKSCTKNPNRICRMCKMLDKVQKPTKELLDLLPDHDPSDLVFRFGERNEPIEAGIDKLRKITEDCPACILAALRQKGIPVPATSFDFEKECKSAWADFNDEQIRRENQCY
jgi:hypothetical protein